MRISDWSSDVCSSDLKIWDQMYFATQYYGRKGLVVNAISGVDLALWDLLGKLRGEPVYHMLGGAVRDELQFYATGARPDLAKEMGFIGGRSEEHTSELQSLMRISYAVFCLKKKKKD